MSGTRVCYVSEDGKDAFLLLGSDLYRMRAGDERPYQLFLDAGGTNINARRFVFEDTKLQQKGRLQFNGTTCRVRTSALAETDYVLGVMPEDIGTPERLAEFDFRQEPALLFRGRDTNMFVYLSRGVHAPKDRLDRLILIRLRPDGIPDSWRDFGTVHELRTTANHAPRAYRVEKSTHVLYLAPQRVLDTGWWGEIGDGVILEKIPLERYDIRHELNGSLFMFAPRG